MLLPGLSCSTGAVSGTLPGLYLVGKYWEQKASTRAIAVADKASMRKCERRVNEPAEGAPLLECGRAETTFAAGSFDWIGE